MPKFRAASISLKSVLVTIFYVLTAVVLLLIFTSNVDLPEMAATYAVISFLCIFYPPIGFKSENKFAFKDISTRNNTEDIDSATDEEDCEDKSIEIVDDFDAYDRRKRLVKLRKKKRIKCRKK